jgi:general L-amino acid transport system permease protein
MMAVYHAQPAHQRVHELVQRARRADGAVMEEQRRPPRVLLPGPVEWLRDNLFSTPLNAVLTLVAVFLIYWIVVPFVQWAIVDAVWSGTTRDACLAQENGACWPFITQRIDQFVYGFYDVAGRWRVDLTLAALAAGLLWLTLPGLPGKRGVGAAMLTMFPVGLCVAGRRLRA